MKPPAPTFNLIDAPWLSLRPLDGGPVREVGLWEALTEARSHQRIDDPSPLVTVALLRLCLAVLHRALQGPKDAAQAAGWYRDGFPAGQVEAYLDRWQGRFDLFGGAPFWQVADLTPELEDGRYRSHWTRLGAEVGSANTTPLFNPAARPGGERRDALSLAGAARRLVEAQTFMLGGLIKRFTTAAKAAPVATAALTVPQGRTLHETLCLNLVPLAAGELEADRPVWEREPLTVADVRAYHEHGRTRAPQGPVDRYTWVSRSVRLHPEPGPDGGEVVRVVGFAAGVPLEGSGEGAGLNVDPHVALRPGGDPRAPALFPQKLRREVLFWRDLAALLPDPQDTATVTAAGKVRSVPGVPPRAVAHAREVLKALRPAPAPPPPGLSREERRAWVVEAARRSGAQPVIPVSVFGQITDQGKGFAFRQEEYTLPEAFVNDPAAFAKQIHTALSDAKTVGEGLRQATRRLAGEVLSRGGTREPHKDDVTRLADGLPTLPTFWARLEAPFRVYLAALDLDAGEALAAWHRTLTHAAWDAWALALEGVGDSRANASAAYRPRVTEGKRQLSPQATLEIALRRIAAEPQEVSA
ncbi:type I-E CRISPR-associated protein Cse1/CasA [Deinococcus planocerae]|uniref:type I-E CRISPR-associated protein Cse1/CasA n=1 Tax=Deinococcus planocerae TaxID=1737569 RepID=UPI000C7EB217|nr:type I-E CRISPR-associated protein Cse1/CasA [Deinococcus planocerae]